ncbi:UNKNOWN [Stylonychia lemnae]|uniref:Uncharacterized protein n=1 Tax=Stylonychia lemnae TaxID=5949 RepID=A0A078A1T8_STYLE|nr:UNKNOWN [Stylonychia lemnae]|eukprot:CDW76085.1 UNKNOWN [Stylonychia lemnae]
MGNIDSRSQFEFGYLMVQTDKPFYEPGEVITGKVYIRCNTPYDAKHIILKIKGKEKGSWIQTVHRTVRNPDGTSRTVSEKIKRKSRRNIMESKAPCFVFTQGLIPGDYVVPFSFSLPSGIPSSMHFMNRGDLRHPKAQVKYSIKAFIETNTHGVGMGYKQILLVREHPPNFEVNIERTSENLVKTWCCVNQGFSKIMVRFEKNTFLPYEKCKTQILLDNSRCNIALKTVRFCIEQEIVINCNGHVYRGTKVLKEKHDDGVPARHPQISEREIEIDLSEIKYPVPEHRRKRGQLRKVTPEEAFQMGQAQPACHGLIIRNEYFLTVKTVFEGCTCCADLPMAKIPLVIIPYISLVSEGYSVPPDYNPMIQKHCDIALQF